MMMVLTMIVAYYPIWKMIMGEYVVNVIIKYNISFIITCTYLFFSISINRIREDIHDDDKATHDDTVDDDDAVLDEHHPLASLNTNNLDANSFAQSINIDFTNCANVAAFIHTSKDVYKNKKYTEQLQHMSLNGSSYEDDKARSIARFFYILSMHPQLSNLADIVADPESNDENAKEGGSCMIERLVILTRGVKTSAKYTIINSAFLIFGQDLKLKKSKHVDLTQR